MGTFIIVFLLFLLFVGMVGVAIYFVKKNDPNRLDTSNTTGVQTAQEFMPWVDIKDQMILLGNHQYRAIIEVSSVNYALRNDREKDIIELSFQSLLNGLTHPITLFVSTREMDYTKLIQSMKEDYERTYQAFPKMREYLQQNLIDMQNLSHNLGETRHKKKYIVVPYDANELTELDDEEKYEATREALFERVSNLQGGLSRINGLNSRILDTVDIMDLLIQTYHRDGSKFAEDLYNGELTSMIVDSVDVARRAEFTDEELFDLTLSQMQSSLETQFIHNSQTTNDMKLKAQEMWEKIHNYRQSGDIDGFKINHQRERELEFQRQIENGEVTTFETNRRHQNVTKTEETNRGEFL